MLDRKDRLLLRELQRDARFDDAGLGGANGHVEFRVLAARARIGRCWCH